MIRKAKLVILSLALTAVPLVAQTAGTPDLSHAVDPGMWETTMQMKMAGMPMTMPEQKTRHCVTQADLDKFHGIPQPQNTKDMTCTVETFKIVGNDATYAVKCTGTMGDMEMHGKWTRDSRQAYHGTTTMTGTMQGHQMEMTSSFTSKRVGDCPASGGHRR